MTNRTLIDGSIEIDAPPADVWKVVSDLKRMGEWSPQCKRMFVLGREVKQGTRTININAGGKLHWPTTAKIVEFEPERKIAWRVIENRTIWGYELEPTESGGTKVTETRRAPEGVSNLSNAFARRTVGDTEKFEAMLERGIAKTLARIKAEVEAA